MNKWMEGAKNTDPAVVVPLAWTSETCGDTPPDIYDDTADRRTANFYLFFLSLLSYVCWAMVFDVVKSVIHLWSKWFYG